MLTESAVRGKQKRYQLIKRTAVLNGIYGIIGLAVLGTQWHQPTCGVPIREVTTTIIVVDLFFWPWMVGKMAQLGYPKWTTSCRVMCSALLYIVATLVARSLIQQMIVSHAANATNGEECQILSVTDQCSSCANAQIAVPICNRCQQCFDCATPIADVWYMLNLAYIVLEIAAIGSFLFITCCVCCCIPACMRCKKGARSTVGIRLEEDQTELIAPSGALSDQHVRNPTSTQQQQQEAEKFVTQLHHTLNKDPDADMSGFETRVASERKR